MPFRISALPFEPFAPLFDLDDRALAERGARRVVADTSPGFPCRVSLVDAGPGETLILTHHEHHPVDTPFRSSHAIYVRAGATRAFPAIGEVPLQLARRTLSVRGFDATGMMRGADLAEGDRLGTTITALLADPATAYLHVHFARPGCYAARVDRA